MATLFGLAVCSAPPPQAVEPVSSRGPAKATTATYIEVSLGSGCARLSATLADQKQPVVYYRGSTTVLLLEGSGRLAVSCGADLGASAKEVAAKRCGTAVPVVIGTGADAVTLIRLEECRHGLFLLGDVGGRVCENMTGSTAGISEQQAVLVGAALVQLKRTFSPGPCPGPRT